jgi:hypothetical protein
MEERRLRTEKLLYAMQDKLDHLEKLILKLTERVQILEDRNPPFKKPAQAEVQEYFNFKNRGELAEDFYNFYDSKGWMVGKVKMKDWKRAAARWINSNPNKQKSSIFDI